MAEIRKTVVSRFVSSSISGSILLLIATVLAIIFANSELSELYLSLCNEQIKLFIGSVDVFKSAEGNMTITRFVNDALMAVFFFAVGLEIKREMLVGELSNTKKALLPIIGALGGIIFPVLIFYFISRGTPAEVGLAIPMATDIAFSLGILSLLGKRVPVGLKVFLTALAVADDLGGILVIAIFYSSHIAFQYLFISFLIMIILYYGARKGVNSKSFYVLLGIAMWFMFYYAGIHPTIAGVVTAFFVPAKTKIDSYQFLAKLKNNISRFPTLIHVYKEPVVLSHDQTDTIHRVRVATNKVISPLQKMEEMLHPVITFFIIPLFAFINAGVILEGVTISTITSEATLGVFSGLLFGKFIGIFSFVFISIKLGLVSMPNGVTLKQLASISIIGGVGFTVSLFITDLSYEHIPVIGKTLLNEAKIGIIAASLCASVIGYFVLKTQLPKEKVTMNDNEIEYSN